HDGPEPGVGRLLVGESIAHGLKNLLPELRDGLRLHVRDGHCLTSLWVRAWTSPQGGGSRGVAPVAATCREDWSRSGKLHRTYPHRLPWAKPQGAIRVKPETSSSLPHVLNNPRSEAVARVVSASTPKPESLPEGVAAT